MFIEIFSNFIRLLICSMESVSGENTSTQICVDVHYQRVISELSTDIGIPISALICKVGMQKPFFCLKF